MAQGNNNINFKLNFDIGDTKGFTELKRQLNEVKQFAKSPDVGVNLEQIQSTIKAANTLEFALKKAYDPVLNTVNIQKFNNILKQSGTNVVELQKNLSVAGAAGQNAFLNMTTQMMQFNSATKQTNTFLNDLSKSLFNTIKYTVFNAILNKISSTIQTSYNYVKNLDGALNDIRIVTGKSADEMERFSAKANDAAKSLAVSTENYTKGALIYFQQGLDENTVDALTEITAKTSNVTGQSMEAVSEQLTAVQNGYQVANKAAEEGLGVYEEYVDKMAAVGATTASNLEELSTAMSKVASAASSMGVDFDDLNAQIATIVSVTRQAPESVGTALKTIYARLGDLKVDGVDEFGTKLGEVSGQLQTMGINILDQQGNMRNMSEVIAEVAEKWDTQTEAQRQAAAVAMAGKRQYNNLIALFDNQDMYGKALETSMNAAGTLEKQQDIALESLNKKLTILRATAEGLYSALFDTDTISGYVEAGTKILELLTNITKGIGSLNQIVPALGASLLQLFSSQIASGVGTFLNNIHVGNQELKVMQENAKQLQMLFSDSSLIKSLENQGATGIAAKESFEQMKQYYNGIQPYQKLMSQAEQEQNTLILERLRLLGETKVKIAEQQPVQEEQAKAIGLINKEILKETTNVEELATHVDQIKTIIDQTQSGLGSKGFFKADDATKAQIFKESFRELAEGANISQDRVQKLQREFNRLYNESNSTEEAIRKFKQVVSDLGNAGHGLGEMSNQAKILDENIKSAAQTLQNGLQTKSLVNDIVSVTSASLQLINTFNTLKNVQNTIQNDDLDPGEKATQIVSGLLFATLSLLPALKAIGKVVAENAIQRTITNKLTGTSITLEQILTKEVTKEKIEQALLTKRLEEAAIAEGVESTALSAETRAHIAAGAAKDAHTISTITLTGAINKLKLAILSMPVAAAVAGMALLIGTLGTAITQIAIEAQERQEVARQTRLAEHNAFIEAREEKLQEINDNRELAESYLDLYALYEKGLTTKEALAEKTAGLEEILGRERVAVANLTGDYKSLNDELRQYNINKVQEQINQNNNNVNEAESHLKDLDNTILVNKKGNYSIDSLIAEYVNNNPEYFEKTTATVEGEKRRALKVQEKDFTKEEQEEILRLLTELEKDINRANQVSLESHAGAIDIDKTNLQEQTRQSADIVSINRDTEIQQIARDMLSNHNFYNMDYEEFNKVLTEVIDQLGETTLYNKKYDNYDLRFEKALEMIGQYSDNNKDYSTRAYATKTITDKYGSKVAEGFNLQEYLSKLGLEDLQYIINGQVVIDKDTSEKDINKQLDAIKSDLKDDGSLDIVTSLRDKMTSGKKMTKKELEEAMGEKAGLANQYIDFSDFDNQSELEQIKTINEVADAEIERNRERLKSAKSTAKEKLEYYEKISQEMSKYEINNGTAINNLNKEDMARYKELKEILEGFPMDTVAELREIAEDGLSFDEIDNTVFNDLISGIDGVISEAEVLKNLAEDIGENQTIAADDVARFGKNFPDIIAAEENYVFLQDGSLQLTEKGQAALQETVDAEKAKLIAENENYQLELRHQADIQKATADYYTQQADLLEDYLNGKVSAKDAERQLEDNTNDYVRKLTELTGEDNEELNRIMQENAGKTAENAQENTQAIYDYWCSVGETAAKAALAYDSKDFTPPVGPSGKQGPVLTADTSAYNKRDVDKNSQLGNMSTEAIVNTINSYREMAEGANNKYSEYMSKIADIGATTNASINAMDRAASGKGGKESKSKSGGSKKDKDKDEKEQEDEFDRYWEIKKAIDAVDKALSKLEKDKQNLYGYELIDALRQENELLEQQAANYNTLYEMQQQEAAELREQLGAMGLMFDASGAITNYAAATSAALQQYAAAIEQYNAGLIDETTFKVYEKAYENFKKLLERYDNLYYTEMQQTQEKLDEIRRKELANNLKAWEVEIQIHLDKEKMKRDQNDFLKDIKQDFRKVFSDLTIDVKYDEKNFKSLVNDVQTTTKAIGDVEAEIDKMMAGGDSTMFESVSQAQEKLKELQEQLLDQGKALRELYKQVQETYLEGIDQVKEQFDELMSRYEKFNNELEFHKELIELLYGDKAYDLMDKYYETQTKNIEAQIESLRKQADFQQSEFQKSYETAIKSGSKVDIDDFTTQTEDMKKAYENMIEAQGNLNDLVLEGVKILQDQYLNSINKIMDAMDKNVWGRDGFEGMKDNWEFMQKMASEYLDAVEGGAKIQLFANRMDMDKANASSLKAQQKIQAFREKEIEALREKENLTQADIDLAEARYQIMLKEIALEDAQNNKTSMKLTRNEQGNQSYQYVADEDDVGQKQQDLLQSYADLYKLADDSYNHSMELAFDLYEEMNEKIRAIYEEHKDDPELAYQLALEIQEQYLPQIEAAAGNSELYKQEAMQATAGVFQTICDQDATAYDTLTQKQKDLVDSLRDKNFEDYDDMRTHLIEGFYPDLNTITEEVFKNMNINSQTTAAAVIDQQVKNPDSVKNEVNKAVSAMQGAIQEYEKELDKLQQIADMDFSKIGESIDKVSQKIDNMGGTTDKMVNNSSQYLDELRRALEAIADKQNSVIEQILAAQRAMQEYINLAAQARAASQATTGGGTGSRGYGPATGPGGNKDNPDEDENNQTDDNTDKFKIIAYDGHHGTDITVESNGGKGFSLNEVHSLYQSNQRTQLEAGLSNFRFQNIAKNAGFPAYRTGGYTGKQNDNSGRLAVLHQKELVLNADDTENFLSGISMIRDMTSLNGSINDAIANAVANMMFALNRTYSNPILAASEKESITPNIFNITAEFPNANDVNEIREAILSLPNLASQYISQNTI